MPKTWLAAENYVRQIILSAKRFCPPKIFPIRCESDFSVCLLFLSIQIDPRFMVDQKIFFFSFYEKLQNRKGIFFGWYENFSINLDGYQRFLRIFEGYEKNFEVGYENF